LVKEKLSKSQWRQIRRKNDSSVLLDFYGPFSEEDLKLLESEGFSVYHPSYPGGWGTYLKPPLIKNLDLK
jgi:hypothetical protein